MLKGRHPFSSCTRQHDFHIRISSLLCSPTALPSPIGPVGIVRCCPPTVRTTRFRTPSACFEPRLQIVAVSGDRPDRLTPGEPSLWRVLRERVTVPSVGGGGEGSTPPIDLVLHAGGQAWMGDAFEDAWELLSRRAMEPLLCAEGGWKEAQQEAAECMREVR